MFVTISIFFPWLIFEDFLNPRKIQQIYINLYADHVNVVRFYQNFNLVIKIFL